MKKRFSCFAVAVVLLVLTLWFTSCGATSADAETKAETSDRPCYHVTVYSPAIEDGEHAARRHPKYTITKELDKECAA